MEVGEIGVAASLLENLPRSRRPTPESASDHLFAIRGLFGGKSVHRGREDWIIRPKAFRFQVFVPFEKMPLGSIPTDRKEGGEDFLRIFSLYSVGGVLVNEFLFRVEILHSQGGDSGDTHSRDKSERNKRAIPQVNFIFHVYRFNDGFRFFKGGHLLGGALSGYAGITFGKAQELDFVFDEFALVDGLSRKPLEKSFDPPKVVVLGHDGNGADLGVSLARFEPIAKGECLRFVEVGEVVVFGEQLPLPDSFGEGIERAFGKSLRPLEVLEKLPFFLLVLVG